MFQKLFQTGRRFYSFKRFRLEGWWRKDDYLSMLEKYGLPREDIIQSVENGSLSTDMDLVKNAAEILEETKIPVDIKKVTRFGDLFVSSIDGLVKHNILATNEVAENYLKYLENFPYQPELRMPSLAGIATVYKPITQYHRRKVTATEFVADYPNDLPEETEKTIQTEQRRVLRQYYVWHFGSDYCTIDKLMYNYSKIYCFRSLRSIRKTLDILENKLELPRKKILRNFFLLTVTPDRLTDVVTNVSKIGDLELKKAADISPKILAKPSAHILEMERMLQEYKIPDCSSPYRVHVLTYATKTLESRLREMAASDLAGFMLNPRACQILYYFPKALRRMQELKKRGLNCFSLNVLTSNENVYLNFINDGVDRSRRVSDIVYHIAYKLEVSKEEVEVLLNCHSFRFYIPLSEVTETLNYLLEQGFNKQVILEAAPLTLYSRDKIEEVLNQLPNNSELIPYGLKGGFTETAESRFPSGSKMKDKRLLLCLYYLEKPFNFTGEGAMRRPGEKK